METIELQSHTRKTLKLCGMEVIVDPHISGIQIKKWQIIDMDTTNKAQITHRHISNDSDSDLTFIAPMTKEQAKERAEKHDRKIIWYKVISTSP